MVLPKFELLVNSAPSPAIFLEAGAFIVCVVDNVPPSTIFPVDSLTLAFEPRLNDLEFKSKFPLDNVRVPLTVILLERSTLFAALLVIRLLKVSPFEFAIVWFPLAPLKIIELVGGINVPELFQLPGSIIFAEPPVMVVPLPIVNHWDKTVMFNSVIKKNVILIFFILVFQLLIAIKMTELHAHRRL